SVPVKLSLRRCFAPAPSARQSGLLCSTMTPPSDHPRREFGDIHISLFDQTHRGRIRDGMSILDAGCGGGRNLVYLMRRGFDVFGTDANEAAIGAVRQLASRLAPALPADHFRTEPVERMSFSDATFDVVISSAVMHFARDEQHWRAMLDDTIRVMQPGAMVFARLAH